MTGSAPGATSLPELRECGRQALAADPGLVARLNSSIQETDPAILYLTSGATGEPRWVPLRRSLYAVPVSAVPASDRE